MAGTYEVIESSDGQSYFNLKAGNGEVILTSERYTQKSSAINGIESVRKNSSLDERYERKESKAGEPYFVLKATNHEVIGRSEMYSSATARDNGIESVKTNGPVATVEDTTS